MADNNGVVIVDIPEGTTIHINGFTNSGSWAQQIIVEPNAGSPALTWTGGPGPQNNQLVGQYTIARSAGATQLKVQMQFNPGSGYTLSTVQVTPYGFPGLNGFVVGGQDGGGRPSGPAFWNTVVFVYWAPGY